MNSYLKYNIIKGTTAPKEEKVGQICIHPAHNTKREALEGGSSLLNALYISKPKTNNARKSKRIGLVTNRGIGKCININGQIRIL